MQSYLHIKFSQGGVQLFSSKEVLRAFTKRIVVVKAGTSMLVIDKLASQKPCSEGPARLKRSASPLVVA